MSEDREDAPPVGGRGLNRSADLLGRESSPIRKYLAKKYTQLKRAFENQSERADTLLDYWNLYKCVLDAKQYYNGDAENYIPLIRDAINAHVTRYGNQLCPPSRTYIQATSSDGSTPRAIVALVQHYIHQINLKTQILRPMIVHADIEGHINLYVDWFSQKRQIVSREKHGPTASIGGEEIEMPGDDVEDIKIEDLIEAHPIVEVIHDADVAVWPANADTVDEAFNAGGGAAIVRRWSKAKVERMLDSGDIKHKNKEEFLNSIGISGSRKMGTPPDTEKVLGEIVGVRKKGEEFIAVEIWCMVPLDGDGKFDEKKGEPRLCRTYYAAFDDEPLGCVRNPHWNDRCPLGSWPVTKDAGVHKGEPEVQRVASLQYEANDAINEAADVAHYGALPIIKRDPATAGKQPLVLNVAAIWDVPPNSVEFAEFPDLTPRAGERIQAVQGLVQQSLSINPSMLPMAQNKNNRRNQAQIAQEQAIDLLTTSEGVEVLEMALTWLMEWFVDLDYQYRDHDVSVRMYGAEGKRANMEAVPPQQTRERYEFTWWGAEAARNAAQYQQQIAWVNVARTMEQSLAQQGKRLNYAPILEASAMGVFSPRLAEQVIIDEQAALAVDPQEENAWLDEGFDVPIHPGDDDRQHMLQHQQGAQRSGDPHGNYKIHQARHMMQMSLKTRAQMMPQPMMPQPGQTPGPGAQPPRGGAPPRAGAMPQAPQMMKGPPGGIHPDQMPRAGAIPFPRKM